MDRLSIDTVNVAEDLFGSGKHGFTDGNDLEGIGATIPGAEPFNAVQEEILAVIEGEALVPSRENLGQLYQAIKLLVGRLAGGAVSKVDWFPSRDVIPASYLPADGQVVLRSAAPLLYAQIANLPMAIEGLWISDKTKRGSYTQGDGSTTFRLPDYNGIYSGSQRVFLSGDGTNAGSIGEVQKASLLTGDNSGDNTVNAASSIETERHLWGWDPVDVSDLYPGVESRAVPSTSAGGMGDDHCGTARPANVAGVWCIFIGVTDAPELP